MEEDGHDYFESQTPQFFKIILHETLQSGKLGVPRSFTRKHGSGFCSNKVYLKVASADVWQVELYKENGNLWLHNGWQQFVEFYHIQFGYFLVFGYQGNSEFQVLIFDKSASEIMYPLKSCIESKQNDGVLPIQTEIEISDSEMLVDYNACRINANKNTNSPGKGSEDDDGKNGELGTSKSLAGQNPLGTRDFNSSNQYIRVLILSNHVNSCILHLPHWKTFARDNNMMVGDVCVLELVDSVEFHSCVCILRAAKDGNSNGSSAEILGAPTRSHIANNSSFKLTMTESRIHRKHVDLPRGIAKQLKKKTQDAILEVAGRLWCVSANYHQKTERGTLFNGWDTFMMDNSLRAGDVCEFEVTDMEPMVLKVIIHKYSPRSAVTSGVFSLADVKNDLTQHWLIECSDEAKAQTIIS